jgi:hypothetical protein
MKYADTNNAFGTLCTFALYPDAVPLKGYRASCMQYREFLILIHCPVTPGLPGVSYTENLPHFNVPSLCPRVACAIKAYGDEGLMFFFIWFVRLLALRPLLAYCASLG